MNELRRVTVSIREADYQYLVETQNRVTRTTGFKVGISFVLRLMIGHMIRTKVNIATPEALISDAIESDTGN